MRILKISGIILGILLIVILTGYFFPAKISIEESRVIDAPVEMVYDQVNNLYNWEKWSPWHKIDPLMRLSYQNGGIGEGSSYTWESHHKNVGNGKLSIVKSKEFDFIDTEMDFGDAGVGTASFKFSKTDNGVLVSWDMHSHVGNCPFMRWMSLLIKKSVRDAYNRGLSDIEAECNYLKKRDWFYVRVKSKRGMNYYSITDEVPLAQMTNKMDEFYKILYSAIDDEQIKIISPPFALYHTWGDPIKMECGIGVAESALVIKGIEGRLLPDQDYAEIKFEGSYENFNKPHEFLSAWLQKYKKTLNGPVIEIYAKGPMSEKDPNKFVTYILYPIK